FNLRMDEGYSDLIGRFENNFVPYFMNPEGTLYDVIIPNVSKDNSFRPNQLYALSLPFGVLDKDRQKIIFEAISSKLYTPFGLRTLDMDDPNFIGEYFGDREQRDDAYHQGTVWPVL